MTPKPFPTSHRAATECDRQFRQRDSEIEAIGEQREVRQRFPKTRWLRQRATTTMPQSTARLVRRLSHTISGNSTIIGELDLDRPQHAVDRIGKSGTVLQQDRRADHGSRQELVEPPGCAGERRMPDDDSDNGGKDDRQPHDQERAATAAAPQRRRNAEARSPHCVGAATRRAPGHSAHRTGSLAVLGWIEHLAGREQRIARPAAQNVRILDAAVAHDREAMADGDAQGRNATQRLQPERMPLEAKIPSHRAMLAARPLTCNLKRFRRKIAPSRCASRVGLGRRAATDKET